MSSIGVGGRILRTAPVWIVGLALLTAAATWLLRSSLVLLIPAALLAVPVLGRRLLSHPIEVLALFLLVVVNLDFFKLGGARVTLDVIVSSALLWAILIRMGLQRRRSSFGTVEWAYTVFLAATLISVAVSVSPGESLKRWGRELQYLVFFAFLVGQTVSHKEERRLVTAVVFSSLAPCILGLIGYFGGADPFLGQELYMGPTGQAEQRVVATLSHPVTLSLYLAFVGALTFSLLLDGKQIARRYLVPVFSLQMVVLLLTYGRTGWIAFAAAVVCLVWLRGPRRLLLPLPAIIAAAALLMPQFLQRWEATFASGEENSVLWRLGLWAYALKVFLQEPIFGSGLGTFTGHVHYLKGHPPHQTWIGLLVETGVVGTLAFLVLMILLGRALWARHGKVEGPRKPILQGVIAGWVALMVGSLGANTFSLPSVVVYLWTMAGLCLARGARAPADAEPPSPDRQG